ncbi:radical SAM enzyme, Cfr family [Thermincola ferriacetica]|uniref:Probable dual-specificity RNA methyltransferase RlmN n=1 Tax=Thermincola ferriacetica TaxID=281456 RepID=A0A0L6VZU7_9FIRM|nr:23S rRNA (adenine(2503)-C(2))-methyltransferase RlmN [Thermincola ferriacetica]KNZ68736.1 radical SAM enzyme, Cfr family [Thermincola ferriacetica]
MSALTNLKDLSLEELTAFLIELGEKSFRAKQIADWVFKKGVAEIADMTNLPLSLRERLSKTAYIGRLEIIKEQQGRDGTTKYLFELADGNTVETVFLKHNYGNSVCVSTQVGCKMGCLFCASTIGGFYRNLSPGEIYDQVLRIEQNKKKRISSVVIMGSGEPLDNYEAVLKFIRLITAPYALNVGMRHITLSTCGLVPQIYKLAEEKLALTLSVSLHAPNNELRNKLMPVNRKYPLEELIPACHEYIKKTGRRITFEYTLIKDVNDSQGHAEELARLIKGMLCHVNLIPVNPVAERRWYRPSTETVKRFQTILERNRVPATVRREMGTDIDAACGQLRRKYNLALETGGKKDGFLD